MCKPLRGMLLVVLLAGELGCTVARKRSMLVLAARSRVWLPLLGGCGAGTGEWWARGEVFMEDLYMCGSDGDVVVAGMG